MTRVGLTSRSRSHNARCDTACWGVHRLVSQACGNLLTPTTRCGDVLTPTTRCGDVLTPTTRCGDVLTPTARNCFQNNTGVRSLRIVNGSDLFWIIIRTLRHGRI